MTSETSEAFTPLNLQFKEVFNKSTNKQETLPAIHKFFMEERECVPYVGPPLAILAQSSADYQASLEEYQERLTFIRDDLVWLLSLSYQKFWCQIIFDESAQRMIDSYLKLSPRPHDSLKLKQLPPTIRNLHNSIHRYVFLVCLRMSTYKESKENFITQEAFSDTIYNNFLFDIPKIFDLCVLYKKNPILKKMIENLFSSQKNYFEDFRQCVRDISKSIEMGKRKLKTLFEIDGGVSFNSNENDNSNKTKSLKNKFKNNLKEIFEIIYYLTDSLISLNDLISFESKIAEILMNDKFDKSIKDIMESAVFDIDETLKKLKSKNQNDKDLIEIINLIKPKIKTLKYELGKLFNNMIVNCYVTPIMENIDSNSSRIEKCADSFTRVCCDLLEDDVRFLCFYEEKFFLSEQLDLIYQIGKIDESQYKYLVENIKSIIVNNTKSESVRTRFKGEIATSKPSYDYDSVTPKPSTSKDSCEKSTSVNNKDVSSMKQSILDLFPDQNEVFIEKCLKYYDYNVEQVINSMLENNLPSFAEEADFKESKLTKNEDSVIEKFSELNLRKNIYDGDQFDVFKSEKVHTSKMHQGKKNTTDKFDLDNKDDINREFFTNYDHIMFAREEMEYEDEYDDTYDENIAANDDFEIKPLNKKLDLTKREMFELEEEDEENQNEDGGDQKASNQINPNNNRLNTATNLRSQQFNQTRNFQPKQSNPEQQNRNRPRFSGKGSGEETDNQYQKKPGFYQQRQEAVKTYSNQKYKDKKVDDENSTVDSQNFNDNLKQQQQPQQSHNQPNQQKNYEALPQRQNQRNNQRAQQMQNNSNKAQASHNQKETRDERQQQQQGQRQRNSNAEEATGTSTAKTEEEIKRERRWKNDNKAKVVHHNRKELAAKKNNFY